MTEQIDARLLYLSSGRSLDGGVASVARSLTSRFDLFQESGPFRYKSLDLYRDGETWSGATPTSLWRKARFVASALMLRISFRPTHVLFEHLDLVPALPRWARSGVSSAVVVYLIELSGAPHRVSALQSVDEVFAISAFTRERVLSVAPHVASGLHLLPIGIEPDRLNAWKELPQPPQAKDRKPAVLIVARMDQAEGEKGHRELLEAISIVRRDGPEAELWIVGGGDAREELEAIAVHRKLGSAVRFFGRASDLELIELFRTASIFAMPSRQEGFGLVYLEAFFHGLPCVASCEDAAAELVLNGVSGCTIPYGDGNALANVLRSLLRDPEERDRLAMAGRVIALERSNGVCLEEALVRNFLGRSNDH